MVVVDNIERIRSETTTNRRRVHPLVRFWETHRERRKDAD